MEKISEEVNQWWKDILHHWVGWIYIVQMAILLKALYRFNAISTRILMTIFTKQEKNPKKDMETQKAWMAKASKEDGDFGKHH